MRKFVVVFAVAMMVAPFALAQTEQIDASTVNFFTPDPLPAPGTFDLCFNVTVDSPDAEYMDRFEVDLPDGWTINTVTPPARTGCGSADPVTGGTEAGNVVYWQGANYVPAGSGCGAWNNSTYDFCANVTMPSYTGPYDFPWTIWGDVWGAAPHSVSGTISGVVPVELMSFEIE
jgi:hypothetical protein